MRFFRETVFVTIVFATSGGAVAEDIPDVTYDGLVRVDAPEYKVVWVDPNIDFSAYNKYIPGSAQFQFRAVKKTSTLASRSSNQREFWLSDKDKKKLEETVSAVFADELSKSEVFTEVVDPGPDTLVIRGALLDIVSQVPPELVGRGEIYLSSVAEATLVIEAVDSFSGAVVYRAVERRSAQRPGRDFIRANTVTTWAEVRRLARHWAVSLREAMDSVRD